MDPLTSSVNANKQLKEEFVSNLTGSSMLEIAALMTIVPILILLRHWTSRKGEYDPLHVTKASSKKDDNVAFGFRNRTTYMIMLATDFIFVVLPMLLYFTVLAGWAQISAICLIVLVLSCFAAKRCDSSASSKGVRESVYSFRNNLTSYRVLVMIMTCLCILAVDFEVFPRRYGKTETYGTSLMDLGVGSFVLANALVSRQARNVASMRWKTALHSTAPLIILGFARLISTASVDYQVHVGEYGVHWNFFFTLAAVSMLTSTIDLAPQYCCLLGLLILIGYWGMYLIGVYLGHTLFFGDNTASRIESNQSKNIRIWTLVILFWLSTVILDTYVERVSRRMCNLAYVAFVLTQNFQALAILTLPDLIGQPQRTLVLEGAMNRNLLGLFLLANVLTGLINMPINTISVSSFTALAILVAYAFILCALAAFADLSGIKFKFW